ncbi:MAG TPA: response regulator [Anaerolineaceae bacterium]|nr:response regulator [Anaerolineaceae bacterium]
MESRALALIIEDDERLADIFSKALETAGYQTRILNDGRQAMEILNSTIPTVVALDLHLPFVSGKEILRAIRSDSRFANTRVILTTADAEMASFVEDQCDLVLIKPISFIQLQTLAQRLGSENLRRTKRRPAL